MNATTEQHPCDVWFLAQSKAERRAFLRASTKAFRSVSFSNPDGFARLAKGLHEGFRGYWALRNA